MSAIERSRTHLVLIPSYNPGPMVFETVREARRHWAPVWVVVDGSTDATPERLLAMAREDPDLRVIVLARNRGKGAAVLHGIELAAAEGYTHVLTMDSDGQHPAPCIAPFMARSREDPEAMILGAPIFDASAPAIRLRGRRIANWWENLETLWAGIGDSLFGFRVYPIADLVAVMGANRWMRRFDFDPEVAVRLVWRGVRPVNMPAPVRYLKPEEGGVSHFNYWRDNVLLTWMHIRLVFGFVTRLPWLIRRRVSERRKTGAGKDEPAPFPFPSRRKRGP
jgi:glycosyltransferase involved in cell wall biosynthesis